MNANADRDWKGKHQLFGNSVQLMNLSAAENIVNVIINAVEVLANFSEAGVRLVF